MAHYSPPPGFHRYAPPPSSASFHSGGGGAMSPPAMSPDPLAAGGGGRFGSLNGGQPQHMSSAYSLHGTSSPPPQGMPQQIADAEYNRLLKNYKLAHMRVEEQRKQMLEQERQNALLRKRIALLEGSDSSSTTIIGGNTAGGGGTSVDDVTIRNAASTLERTINRWAADQVSRITRSARLPQGYPIHLALVPLAQAVCADIEAKSQSSPFLDGLRQVDYDYSGIGMVAQSLMRHLMSDLLSDGIINQLLVTNSEDANRELTKIHDQLHEREPLVAAVWRRQTFSAAVQSLNPAISRTLFEEHMPSLFSLINPASDSGAAPSIDPNLAQVFASSYSFSRMLHASRTPGASGGSSALDGASGRYQSFVPEIGTTLDPTRLELIKRCYRTERGEPERVGAVLFPGLAKVSSVEIDGGEEQQAMSLQHSNGRPATAAGAKRRETRLVVVRRAQVICECALAAAPAGPSLAQQQQQQQQGAGAGSPRMHNGAASPSPSLTSGYARPPTAGSDRVGAVRSPPLPPHSPAPAHEYEQNGGGSAYGYAQQPPPPQVGGGYQGPPPASFDAPASSYEHMSYDQPPYEGQPPYDGQQPPQHYQQGSY